MSLYYILYAYTIIIGVRPLPHNKSYTIDHHHPQANNLLIAAAVAAGRVSAPVCGEENPMPADGARVYGERTRRRLRHRPTGTRRLVPAVVIRSQCQFARLSSLLRAVHRSFPLLQSRQSRVGGGGPSRIIRLRFCASAACLLRTSHRRNLIYNNIRARAHTMMIAGLYSGVVFRR